MDERIIELEQQLSASQAREKALRDTLESFSQRAWMDRLVRVELKTALAQLTDDTALKDMLAAEREKYAQVCDEVAKDEFGFYAEDCAGAIRALGEA